MNQAATVPANSWEEDATIVTTSKRRLSKWGSTSQAGKILFGAGRKKVGMLREAGLIRGVKQGTAKNSHWKYDLVSVWEAKVKFETGEHLDTLLR